MSKYLAAQAVVCGLSLGCIIASVLTAGNPVKSNNYVISSVALTVLSTAMTAIHEKRNRDE